MTRFVCARVNVTFRTLPGVNICSLYRHVIGNVLAEKSLKCDCKTEGLCSHCLAVIFKYHKGMALAPALVGYPTHPHTHTQRRPGTGSARSMMMMKMQMKMVMTVLMVTGVFDALLKVHTCLTPQSPERSDALGHASAYPMSGLLFQIAHGKSVCSSGRVMMFGVS